MLLIKEKRGKGKSGSVSSRAEPVPHVLHLESASPLPQDWAVENLIPRAWLGDHKSSRDPVPPLPQEAAVQLG